MSDKTRSNQSTPSAAHTAYGEQQSKRYDQIRFSTHAGKRIDAVERRILHSALRGVPCGARVLEVGCGSGRFLQDVLRRDYLADGLDASRYMLDECQKKIGQNFPDCELTIGSASSMPFDTCTYVFVYSIRLLNQLGTPSIAFAAISEILRVTKNGGLALIEFMSACRIRRPTQTVLLRPAHVIKHATDEGAMVQWLHGAFFLGMTAYHRSPRIALRGVMTLDRILSRIFPRACSRCYLLVRKT